MAAILERLDRHKNYLSIPSSPPANLDSEPRDVFIAHRVMRGDGPIEQFTDIEKGIEKLFNLDDPTEVPHPLHHWGVAVGDIIHHLQSDSFFDSPNYYENKKLPTDEKYILYKVGTTTFNDLAIQEAGVATIYNMPATYDPISNNCQRFTKELLAVIVRSGRVTVWTLEDTSNLVDTFFPGKVGYLKELAKQAMQQPAAGAPPANGVEGLPANSVPETAEVKIPNGVTAAVVEDPEAMEKLLERAEAIMADNTPMVNPGNIVEELKHVELEKVENAVKVPGTKAVEVLDVAA